MEWTLELVVVPVSDVDRAKAFYIEQAGFELLVDSSAGPDFRIVQLTPPGSACAIAIGTGIGSMFHFGDAGQAPGPDPERRSYATFMPFQDPDGNTWLVQEVKRDWKVVEAKIDEAAA